MDGNKISQILMIVLLVLICILFILGVIYIILKLRESSSKSKSNKKINSMSKNKNSTDTAGGTTKATIYNKQSIFDFMEFDKIQDNMISQKKGKRFLMVVQCEGVNYDLMSKMEKVSVEEGFQQFLNTLRHPIQIYIQTRTMNLEKSIQTYKSKVKEIEDKYNKIYREHQMMQESSTYSQEDINKHFYELTKNKNLLEYGKDIIANTERMSLNKNVLTKRYYIIIPYYVEEDSEKYSSDEIQNMAFSELYTKAQSIIATLSACSVAGKILDSNELIELLYMAYNREEADTFGLDKAMQAEFDSLYSTAPDVFEKKIKVIDEEIHNRAIDLANTKIEEVKSRAQEVVEDKENNMDELIQRMAKMILEENKSYVGKDIAERAIKELDNKEGGEPDEKVKKTRRSSKK